MKVYVVTFGEYSDYHIHGIYSNKEKAKEIMMLDDADGDGYGNIEEWDLDNTDPEHKNKRRRFSMISWQSGDTKYMRVLQVLLRR